MTLQINIHPHSMRDSEWFPRRIYIPSEREAAFREGAQRNHSQTVERLNERGGLDPSEIWAIYHGRRWDQLSPLQNIEALRLCVGLSSPPPEQPAQPKEKAEANKEGKS